MTLRNGRQDNTICFPSIRNMSISGEIARSDIRSREKLIETSMALFMVTFLRAMLRLSHILKYIFSIRKGKSVLLSNIKSKRFENSKNYKENVSVFLLHFN